MIYLEQGKYSVHFNLFISTQTFFMCQFTIVVDFYFTLMVPSKTYVHPFIRSIKFFLSTISIIVISFLIFTRLNKIIICLALYAYRSYQQFHMKRTKICKKKPDLLSYAMCAMRYVPQYLPYLLTTTHSSS